MIMQLLQELSDFGLLCLQMRDFGLLCLQMRWKAFIWGKGLRDVRTLSVSTLARSSSYSVLSVLTSSELICEFWHYFYRCIDGAYWGSQMIWFYLWLPSSALHDISLSSNSSVCFHWGGGEGGFEVIWVILNVDPGRLVSSEASWPGSTLL